MDSAIGRSCLSSTFFPNYSRVLDRILAQPDTTTMVACRPEHDDTIFGYAVYQPTILHYVFVKEDFRNNGIAKSLLAQVRPVLSSYTHRTRTVAPILRRCFEWRYNPFELFQQSEKGDSHGQATQQ